MSYRRSTPRPSRRLARRIRRLLLAPLVCALSLGGCALRPGAVRYLVDSPDRRSVVVQTAFGPVSGVATPRGRAFLAVPFAAPTVGALRFRAPQPPQPWTAPLDATRPGASCIQIALPGAGPQSEDCLTLNVYTDAAANPEARRPVMVWIYGGGFALGDNLMYDPSRLAERQGVVVVAMNYRLGVFGFLDHPALDAEGDGAGDFALLDQQAALRWVRANISAFGGDPANVTLFGESAGGWSVCSQLASPGAAELFDKAIIESGACTSPDSAIARSAADAGGTEMAAALGCADPTTAAACLRALPVGALQKAKPHRRGLLGPQSWSPAFGGAVLPLAPVEAFGSGRFNRVPVIDGTNHDEARLFLTLDRLRFGLLTRRAYEKSVERAFGPLAPQVLAQYRDEADASIGRAFADITTDSTFACPALTLDALLARQVRVYAYEFDDPDAVTTLIQPPFTPRLRAYHSSEIAYVMQTPWAIVDPAKFDPAQRALSDRMQAAWAAFARTGAPGSAIGTDWAPLTPAGDPLALTPGGVAPAHGFADAHRCAFWRPLGY